MDPKVLTLFDDEAFQPPPPKPKAVKKERSKEMDKAEPAPAIVEYTVDPVNVAGMEDGSGRDIKKEELVTGQEAAGQKEETDTILDAQMRAALIQADYAQYVYKELPVQAKQQVRGSGIVFEGVVAPKKSEAKNILPEKEVEDQGERSESAYEEPSEALPEWQLESRYYAIGEVAKLFGVNTSHIRFWTTQFKLKPRTTRKGDRLYNANDINQLRLIHHLVKEKKHTIKGAREKLKDKEGIEVKLDLKTSLSRLKDILTEMKNKL